MRVPDLLVAHTSAVDPATLAATRQLLVEAFAEEGFSDNDWENALGGIHVLLLDADEPIGHAAVVQRRLLHRGRALRTGYIEGVAVRADHRGRGHGAVLMDVLEDVLRRAYDLGALNASDRAARFYVTRGWTAWQGPLSALTPNGIEATPDECIYVLAHSLPLDPTGELTCDWREGDLW